MIALTLVSFAIRLTSFHVHMNISGKRCQASLFLPRRVVPGVPLEAPISFGLHRKCDSRYVGDGPDHPPQRDHGRWERDRLRRDDGEDPDPKDTDNKGRE